MPKTHNFEMNFVPEDRQMSMVGRKQIHNNFLLCCAALRCAERRYQRKMFIGIDTRHVMVGYCSAPDASYARDENRRSCLNPHLSVCWWVERNKLAHFCFFNCRCNQPNLCACVRGMSKFAIQTTVYNVQCTLLSSISAPHTHCGLTSLPIPSLIFHSILRHYFYALRLTYSYLNLTIR